jgi:hypothetical protein
VILIGNPCPDSPVRCSGREPHHAGCAMESVEQYRQYAEECRRLVERAPPKEKVALLEIAAAWDECANEAAERGRKTVEGTVFRNDPQAQNGDTS